MDGLYKPAYGCFLVLGLGFSLTALARSPLTFEERVKAQEAIERVYYEHRFWPKENPQPKPPFEEMVPRAVIEAKVTDYLKKCVALEKYWQRPIQPHQLQAEMERMVKQSKDPAMLKELFAALGNGPNRIAECLARPVLADRLLRNWYDSDSRFHSDARAQAENARAGTTMESFQSAPIGECRRVRYLSSSGGEAPQDPQGEGGGVARTLGREDFDRIRREWPKPGTLGFVETEAGGFLGLGLVDTDSEISMDCVLFPVKSFDAWWSEQSALLAPGCPADDDPKPPMRLAFPETACEDQWESGGLSWPGVPDRRYRHTTVWTGAEMIIWGGYGGGLLGTGARYNPATDTWQATSTGATCPVARADHSAVWTGSEMIVWGGNGDGGPLTSGGRYVPSSDSWTPTSNGANVPMQRAEHTCIWTGIEMIVWGGTNGGYWTLNTGGRYRPSTDTWLPTAAAYAPTARDHHAAVWTGSEMIVWGGAGDNGRYVQTGGRYDPAADTWAGTSTAGGCPSPRSYATAVWTGTEMIIWGGADDGHYFASGGRFNPASDTWTATSAGAGCPHGRMGHTALWTGEEMIVWGGLTWEGVTTSALYMNSGGRYDPSGDTWAPTTTGSNCPTARDLHGTIWTGSEMIVWGGEDGTTFVNTGARYDPAADSWIPTSRGTNSPEGRLNHAALWTGAEMVVWGGESTSLWLKRYLPTGGRYMPATDSWAPTPTGSPCPSGRSGHSAVWTGTEVILWGGNDDAETFGVGGRYNPAADSWTATPAGDACPSARTGHTAVWTGSEMIVWGGFTGSDPSFVGTGGRYSPVSNTWREMSGEADCPSGRYQHTSVWSGTEMIVWGGTGTWGDTSTGGRYDPASDTWKPTSTDPSCPAARMRCASAWTGKEMLVWGGDSGPVNTGGLYDPANDTWRSISTGLNCPVGRLGNAIVWTGAELLVWGGSYADASYHIVYPKGVGRYNPATDSWRPVQEGAGCPDGRAAPSAVWTGTRMLVWGGVNAIQYPEAGGAYILLPTSLDLAAEGTPSSGNAPLAVAFAASALPSGCTGTATYAWDFGDGASSVERDPTHMYLQPGVYHWTARAAINGVTAERTGTVTTVLPCLLTCVASASPSSGLAPLDVAFAAGITTQNCLGEPAFSWTFGDGSSSESQNPRHTYAVPGSYEWALTVTVGPQACSRSGAVTVAPVLPGDCDGDGQVSIGEVQRAINMFLGTLAPGGCGVDCDGDGTISIGEVQKAVNAFLGLPSRC